MIATRTIWRWMGSHVEVIEAGERCDWVTPGHVYLTLGWVISAPEEGQP